MSICEIIFAKIILKEEIKVPKYILLLVLIITSIIYTINNIYNYGTLKTAIVFIIHVLMFKYVFKITTSKSIFLTFMYMVLLLLTEIFEIFIAVKCLNISKKGYFEYVGSFISNIIICIVFIIIAFVFRIPLRKIINTKLESHKKIPIYLILIAVCITMFFYSLIKEFRLSNNILMYLAAIAVLLIVLFSLIKQVIENNKLMSRYDKILEFMTTYENEIEKQRTLRHETKNEFLSIRGKIHDKQPETEIITYIDEILKDKIEVKQEEYAKFGYLPPNGIKGLCYLKMQEAQDKGLKAEVNISKRISNSNIYHLNIKEQRDLGKILGVFLDNAIEASLESDAKKIGIEGYLNKAKECELIISNSFTEQIDIEKMGKERFSTKGKNRGHGLLLVKHLINQHEIFDINTQIGNGIYVQKIIIKEKVEK